MNTEKILAVPTNIITGFLGVGKTSAITHLLKQKPANERWAVLVNEFGEIGIDESLFKGQFSKENNVFISQVPGGCMCCSSALPMQIALNQLLTQARPHRLLIEPTGLGHPLEVLQLLSNQYYREILALGKTLTLVDARKLIDKRYTDHDTFNQQLSIADIVIGNKLDLYSDSDKQALASYIEQQHFNPDSVFFTEYSQIELNWLSGATKHLSEPLEKVLANNTQKKQAEPSIPESGFIRATNKGEGFHSIGWRFAANKVFDRPLLHQFLTSIKAIRVKATFITQEGIYAYNYTSDGLVEFELDECIESRIEIICDEVDNNWQNALLKTLAS